MRFHHAVAFVAIVALVASCRQILGIEQAELLCPPEQPDCKLCPYGSKDCGPDTECYVWACRNSLCVPVNAAVHTKCSTGVCSADPLLSACVTCVDDSDCEPGGYCYQGQACYRCDDGIQNGEEWGVDCGGLHCPRCLGDACNDDTLCKSGICADGTCCNDRCDETCADCNNDQGNCSAMPKYLQDESPACGGQYVCDGAGSCLLRPGEICVSDVDCASYRCVMSLCKKQQGEACDKPYECVDDLCVNNVCVN